MQINSKQILAMMYNENEYVDMLDAPNFVKQFKTMYAFRKWASNGSILDLKEYIKVCRNYQLFEYCAVMKELIDNLTKPSICDMKTCKNVKEILGSDELFCPKCKKHF